MFETLFLTSLSKGWPMSTLTKVNKFYKNVKLTKDDKLYVGVDTHKKSYHIAFYLNDAPAIDFVMPSNKEQLSKKLMPLRPALQQVVYETGPCGYGLARHLTKQSIPTSVVATSTIPRPSGQSDKTDRIDSRKLAQYAAKDMLKPVQIPTHKQEADRQLYRMRHRQVRNLSRVKTQIKSFLLMHDVVEPARLANWSHTGIEALRKLKLTDTLRLSLDELLCDLDYHTTRVRQLNKSVAEYFNKGILAQRIAILKTHPGVGTVVACQFATELFHYRNFNSTREVYKYLGLCPKVKQSGDSCIRGSINKASNGRLRGNLIQAAWRWIAVDIQAKKSYQRLLKNNGCIAQKAITAMARKLSGHLWTMLIRDQVYDPRK
jgi:transposase